MTENELINHAKVISEMDAEEDDSVFPEALEFLRIYAGEKSAFYKQLYDRTKDIDPYDSWFGARTISYHVKAALDAFIRFVEKGLLNGKTIQRQAEINVVSDILSQAKILLETKNIHPASPCVVGGAALEEFLRNWVEEQGLNLSKSKPSLDGYSKVLYEKELVDKQDIKDITSWAELRNNAAHGKWDSVNNIEKIQLMIDGISLFIRKYS